MENWKKIENYDNYSVSDIGRVRNDKTCNILKPIPDKGGYLTVCLSRNGKLGYKWKKIHRLVAEAFIPNTNGLETVDHLNHDVADNRVENLQWMSRWDNEINKKTCRNTIILQLTKDGEIVNTFKSTYEAKRKTGIDETNICKCYRGNLKTAGGFVWKRISEERSEIKYGFDEYR